MDGVNGGDAHAGAPARSDDARRRALSAAGVVLDEHGRARPIHGLTLILAGRGAGKTTLLQQLVADERERGASFVVRDYLGHWPRRDDHPPYPKGELWVMRDCSAEEVCRKVIQVAPATGVFDEIDVEIPYNPPPKVGTAVRELLHNGRQASANAAFWRRGPGAIIGAARCAKDVHKSMRRMANFYYLGKIESPEERRWFANEFSREIARRMANLEWGRFITVDRS